MLYRGFEPYLGAESQFADINSIGGATQIHVLLFGSHRRAVLVDLIAGPLWLATHSSLLSLSLAELVGLWPLGELDHATVRLSHRLLDSLRGLMTVVLALVDEHGGRVAGGLPYLVISYICRCGVAYRKQ